MPTRSASGTPTIPLPSPSPPPFVISPNSSYSSNESNESDNLELPPRVPLKDNITNSNASTNLSDYIPPITSTSFSVHIDTGEEEEHEGKEEGGENSGREFGNGEGSSTNLPDWRLSILAQKEYSAAIHKYTEMQWESARVEIERASSATKVKARK